MASSPPHPPSLVAPITTNNPPASYTSTVSPTLSIFVVAFIGLFILLIFFFIYLRFCVGNRPAVTPAAIALSRRESRNRGLDSALLHTFPTMLHSDLKGKHSPDCAVCLCEFEGRDILRLIPACGHVFHRDCIDVWLESHVTCPVCRRNLTSDASAGDAVDREMELADLVRIGSERRGVVVGGREEDVRRRLGRSASLGVLSAGREKDGRVWFWRSLRLSGRERYVDGKSRVSPADDGDDSKAECSQV